MTRLADRSEEPVPDELWDDVAGHYDEKQISALLLSISLVNLFNRVNTATRKPAGTTWG
ncbi:hypothetical protein ACH47Z_25285 [Streptomyces sp. NPDC020192]|uniref:hypothetical protein n=1 Tax=Streptomyces sp. NPDC020192 TaxID=3365066 RepID=UPI0037BD48ED